MIKTATQQNPDTDKITTNKLPKNSLRGYMMINDAGQLKEMKANGRDISNGECF